MMRNDIEKSMDKALLKAMDNVQSKLRWSTAPPTEPGWYWHRPQKDIEAMIIPITDEIVGAEWTDMPHQWAGPIPEPEAPPIPASKSQERRFALQMKSEKADG